MRLATNAEPVLAECGHGAPGGRCAETSRRGGARLLVDTHVERGRASPVRHRHKCLSDSLFTHFVSQQIHTDHLTRVYIPKHGGNIKPNLNTVYTNDVYNKIMFRNTAYACFCSRLLSPPWSYSSETSTFTSMLLLRREDFSWYIS